MRRTTQWAGAVLAGVAMLALAPAAVPGFERPGYETYVVRAGDTLSKIAGRVLGDTGRWRELLKDNPQVTNPNRIYPGDSLLIPVPLTAADVAADRALVARDAAADEAARAAAEAAAAAAAEAAAKAAAEAAAAAAAAEAAAKAVAVPDLPVESAPPAAFVNPALYGSAGFIVDGLPELAIIASQDERDILASGDAAIINAPVPPGRRFTVVSAVRRVFHPQSGRYLGWLVRVLGSAEVTCRGELTSTVALLGMRDAAEIGDYLVPLDPDDVLEENVLPRKAKPGCVSSGLEDAVIVAFDEDRLMAGELELVYIDRGADSCVAPGSRFTIYRPLWPEGQAMLGELQVLRAGAGTATALITTSIQEVHVGDLLRTR